MNERMSVNFKHHFSNFKAGLLTILALLAMLAPSAMGQIDTNVMPQPGPPPTAQSLPGTIVSYFTEFNTNLDDCFGANRFSLWTGASSIQNADIPLVNDLGLSYDILRGSPGTNSATVPFLGIENVWRNGGVGGTLVSVMGGLEGGVIVHDVKVSVYFDGGYDFTDKVNDKAFGEGGLRLFKALGHHFFAGVGMGFRFPESAQVFSAYAGATF
jgi:hypothetical protein